MPQADVITNGAIIISGFPIFLLIHFIFNDTYDDSAIEDRLYDFMDMTSDTECSINMHESYLQELMVTIPVFLNELFLTNFLVFKNWVISCYYNFNQLNQFSQSDTYSLIGISIFDIYVLNDILFELEDSATALSFYSLFNDNTLVLSDVDDFMQDANTDNDNVTQEFFFDSVSLETEASLMFNSDNSQNDQADISAIIDNILSRDYLVDEFFNFQIEDYNTICSVENNDQLFIADDLEDFVFFESVDELLYTEDSSSDVLNSIEFFYDELYYEELESEIYDYEDFAREDLDYLDSSGEDTEGNDSIIDSQGSELQQFSENTGDAETENDSDDINYELNVFDDFLNVDEVSIFDELNLELFNLTDSLILDFEPVINYSIFTDNFVVASLRDIIEDLNLELVFIDNSQLNFETDNCFHINDKYLAELTAYNVFSTESIYENASFSFNVGYFFENSN